MSAGRVLLLEPGLYPGALLREMAAAGAPGITLDCPDNKTFIGELRTAAGSPSPFAAVFLRIGLFCGEDEMAAAGPALRCLVTPTTGLSHIDTDEAGRRGISVLSLKGEVEFLGNVSSTAEHAWALLLAVCRRLPAANKSVAESRWERTTLIGTELRGKTLGVVGLGRLGGMVARYGEAFGMRVLAYDISGAAFDRADGTRVQRTDLHRLLAESDVVSLHIPLDASTRGMFDRTLIETMKAGAILINTSRGEILDEAALLDALEKARLRGAGLDVLAGEDTWAGLVPASHPLVEYARRHDNLVVTPHVGGYTREAVAATREFMVRKFLRWLAEERRPRCTQS